MIHYRRDPKNPRQLTPEEQRRLESAPIAIKSVI